MRFKFHPQSVLTAGLCLIVLALLVSCGANSPAEKTSDAVTQGGASRLTDLSLKQVRIADKFWSPRIETNHQRTLGAVLQRITDSGAIHNLAIAAGKAQGEYRGPFWADSDGLDLTLSQSSNYPWEGRVAFDLGLSRSKEFDINLRLPGWARGTTIKINGRTIRPSVVNGYAKIRRQWANQDTIDLTLPMEVERLEAHPSVAADRGRVALRRGPLIYCLEEQDQTADPDLIVLPMTARLEGRFEPGLLNGVTVIAGQGLKISTGGWEDQLYRPAAISERESVTIKAIPYYAWGNRQLGKFAVWLQSSR